MGSPAVGRSLRVGARRRGREELKAGVARVGGMHGPRSTRERRLETYATRCQGRWRSRGARWSGCSRVWEGDELCGVSEESEGR